MTRHQARMAKSFWGRHDRKQRARDAEVEREAEHFRTDPNEHVRIYECFKLVADLLGREAAMAAWLK